MKSTELKRIFQLISYLQYPFMIMALYFILRPYYDILVLKNREEVLGNINNALIFIGIGISFSTLQDTTKTQNNFSKKVWENKKKGKMVIGLLSVIVLVVLIFGMIGYFTSGNSALEEISLGLIVLGIGLIGFLKTAIEMFENHVKL